MILQRIMQSEENPKIHEMIQFKNGGQIRVCQGIGSGIREVGCNYSGELYLLWGGLVVKAMFCLDCMNAYASTWSITPGGQDITIVWH